MTQGVTLNRVHQNNNKKEPDKTWDISNEMGRTAFKPEKRSKHKKGAQQNRK